MKATAAKKTEEPTVDTTSAATISATAAAAAAAAGGGGGDDGGEEPHIRSLSPYLDTDDDLSEAGPPPPPQQEQQPAVAPAIAEDDPEFRAFVTRDADVALAENADSIYAKQLRLERERTTERIEALKAEQGQLEDELSRAVFHHRTVELELHSDKTKINQLLTYVTVHQFIKLFRFRQRLAHLYKTVHMLHYDLEQRAAAAGPGQQRSEDAEFERKAAEQQLGKEVHEAMQARQTSRQWLLQVEEAVAKLPDFIARLDEKKRHWRETAEGFFQRNIELTSKLLAADELAKKHKAEIRQLRHTVAQRDKQVLVLRLHAEDYRQQARAGAGGPGGAGPAQAGSSAPGLASTDAAQSRRPGHDGSGGGGQAGIGGAARTRATQASFRPNRGPNVRIRFDRGNYQHSEIHALGAQMYMQQQQQQRQAGSGGYTMLPSRRAGESMMGPALRLPNVK